MNRLQPLATQIARIVRPDQCQRPATPVLLVPRHLSLRGPFFVELDAAIRQLGFKATRFEFTIPAGWLARRFALREIRQIRQSFAERSGRLNTQRCFSAVSVIGRPEPISGDAVVGYGDPLITLPPWSVPIRLSDHRS